MQRRKRGSGLPVVYFISSFFLVHWLGLIVPRRGRFVLFSLSFLSFLDLVTALFERVLCTPVSFVGKRRHYTFIHSCLLTGVLYSLFFFHLHQPVVARAAVGGGHKVGSQDKETTQAEPGAHHMQISPYP